MAETCARGRPTSTPCGGHLARSTWQGIHAMLTPCPIRPISLRCANPLSYSSEEVSPEVRKQMALDAICQILAAIEKGVCPLGDWERRCLAAAITSLRAAKSNEARSRARRALWPEENRRDAAIKQFPLKPGMSSLDELKHEFEAGARDAGSRRCAKGQICLGGSRLDFGSVRSSTHDRISEIRHLFQLPGPSRTW